VVTSPTVVAANTGDTPKIQNKATLEEEYNSLLKKYSPNHPDVKAIKRRLDAYDEEHKNQPGQADINNPAYLQLQSELNIAEVELKSINQERQELAAQLQKLEANVAQTHQVERGYYDLVRDLENHKAKYTELKAKSLEAKLSQNLESEQKAEKFSLLEPPRVPEKPEKPNRLKILFLGFVLSIAGGLGAGLAAETLDSSIRNANQLTELTGVEPLVVIPYIENQEDIQISRRNKINFTLIGLILVIGATLAIHFFYMPLGMLINKLSDRISMLL
jgi:predicted RNase H-like nuclease (RuvC/YqgF family)